MPRPPVTKRTAMTRLASFPAIDQTALPPQEPRLGDLLRGWWRILGCALLGAGLGLAYLAWLATPLYRAQATLLLEPQEPQMIDLGQVLPALGRDPQALNTQLEVLRARLLLAGVVDALALTTDPEFNRAIGPEPLLFRLQRMAADKGIVPAPEPATPGPDAQREATITRLADRLELAVQPESLVFTLAIRTRDAAKSARIVNLLAESYIAEQVRTKLSATDQATGWLAARVTELKSQLEAAESLAQSARSASGILGPEQIAEMERRLTALRARLSNATLPPGQREAIATEAADLAERIRAATDGMAALAQLDREADATGLLYESFLTRLKETAIQTGAHQPDARILSPAVAPPSPHSPRPALILLLGLILGAGAGAIWVLAREEWSARLRTAEEAERVTGLPVLASLPELGERHRDPLHHAIQRPDAPLAAAVRSLRGSILLSNLDRPPRVILVTSSVAGEGKTTHALLLAQMLAAWGKSVLLIEADTRRAGILGRLGLPRQRGLLSVLAGLCPLDEALVAPAGLSFSILPGEATSANAADILATGRFRDFLKKMRDTYDHVVIDTPPVLDTADARVLAPAADAVIYAARWNRTTRAQLRRGLAQFRNYGLPVTGIALTRIAPRHARALHGGYHARP
ncbi:AAA family ATPase [Halovulum dunhuangense]|uniref:non-specific protein-tyrosine kinase n=1 Tax=Halovulum dunhuangense TaxID=1505036 RepID=A0A849KU17_9RHOB|nr:polysaccharide biosynthesis tyrosine autokinase [Halovulum dunhuangense]NNU79061.1 AAA family ATPase [Halovulum dunhuangense]